ncbi:hypothetical protein MRB53_001929 [Persea americana]|uniref:Uncharacterized protein n=1 Tax=Persea americana TaxID=3435 RepID=A0ACC2MU10_PERAE|nr:hypothetical protein MRB53_001929 [Persea americana]
MRVWRRLRRWVNKSGGIFFTARWGPARNPKKHDRLSLQLSSSPVSFFFFHDNSEHNVDVGLLWNLATAAVVDGGDKHRRWRSRRWAQRL